MNHQDTHPRRVILDAADRMIGPMVRILAAVGLSEAEVVTACLNHFVLIRRRPRTRKLKVAVRDYKQGAILTTWATHPSYLRGGTPATLNVAGRSPSFTSLVREVDKDLSSSLLLRDWCRSRIARMVGKNRVELLARYVPLQTGKEVDLDSLATMTRDLLRAYEFNILHGTRPGRGLLQRVAYSYDVHPRLASRFNTFAREQATLLLEAIDDWLARHQMPKQRRRRPIRLGLGVYVINETIGRNRGKRGRQSAD
jgi:Family of unknown function (DUF6502)